MDHYSMDPYYYYSMDTDYRPQSGGGTQLRPTDHDDVRNPTHYNMHGIECIAAIRASMSSDAFQGYLKGNVLKYLWRCSYKGDVAKDLRKAEYYLEMLIKEVDQ